MTTEWKKILKELKPDRNVALQTVIIPNKKESIKAAGYILMYGVQLWQTHIAAKWSKTKYSKPFPMFKEWHMYCLQSFSFPEEKKIKKM